MEITFYYTGLHCNITPTMVDPTPGAELHTYGTYVVLDLPTDADSASLVFNITADNRYILNREYVAVVDASNWGQDITDQHYIDRNNQQAVVFDNLTTSSTLRTVVIKIAAVSYMSYTSPYTGLEVDKSVQYTQNIIADKEQVGDGSTEAPAEYAKVNAATLEGYNSAYFCPADRITSENNLGLIKKGSGFVLEEDGTLNTDIKVQVNYYTNTIDLFINTTEE